MSVAGPAFEVASLVIFKSKLSEVLPGQALLLSAVKVISIGLPEFISEGPGV